MKKKNKTLLNIKEYLLLYKKYEQKPNLSLTLSKI